MINVYADESCTGGHRFLVLGGLCLDPGVEDRACEALAAVRHRHQTFGEVKWSKVSRSKLAFYREFVDVFFDFNRRGEIQFHALIVESSTIDRSWNGGSAEIGFNKLIYQLLLHRFGRRYGNQHELHVYLDDRTSAQAPELIRPMLNSALLKQWGNDRRPFRRIQFRDSKLSPMIQLNDLLIGAIGFRKNGHHLRGDCSPNKRVLAEHIVRSAVQTQAPRRLDDRDATFSYWIFRYRNRGGVPAA